VDALGTMFAVIVALHVIVWGTLVFVVEPGHFNVGEKAFGIGIGLTAYTLGLRPRVRRRRYRRDRGRTGRGGHPADHLPGLIDATPHMQNTCRNSCESSA
jgi:hypothetical protein